MNGIFMSTLAGGNAFFIFLQQLTNTLNIEYLY